MSVVENSVNKYRISIAWGRFIKDYLWRKIEVGTLYLPTKSRLTTPPIISCKHQNIVNLPGLYSKHVPIVPVLVESWSGLVNFGSWWPEWASSKNINEKNFQTVAQ